MIWRFSIFFPSFFTLKTDFTLGREGKFTQKFFHFFFSSHEQNFHIFSTALRAFNSLIKFDSEFLHNFGCQCRIGRHKYAELAVNGESATFFSTKITLFQLFSLNFLSETYATTHCRTFKVNQNPNTDWEIGIFLHFILPFDGRGEQKKNLEKNYTSTRSIFSRPTFSSPSFFIVVFHLLAQWHRFWACIERAKWVFSLEWRSNFPHFLSSDFPLISFCRSHVLFLSSFGLLAMRLKESWSLKHGGMWNIQKVIGKRVKINKIGKPRKSLHDRF